MRFAIGACVMRSVSILLALRALHVDAQQCGVLIKSINFEGCGFRLSYAASVTVLYLHILSSEVHVTHMVCTRIW